LFEILDKRATTADEKDFVNLMFEMYQDKSIKVGEHTVFPDKGVSYARWSTVPLAIQFIYGRSNLKSPVLKALIE
jgi:hypothetical protein